MELSFGENVGLALTWKNNVKITTLIFQLLLLKVNALYGLV